jgi:hypothetical protein
MTREGKRERRPRLLRRTLCSLSLASSLQQLFSPAHVKSARRDTATLSLHAAPVRALAERATRRTASAAVERQRMHVWGLGHRMCDEGDACDGHAVSMTRR